MPDRYLKPALGRHLKTLRQMAFLTGPRQVGKTTLAQSFLPSSQPGVNYFNWDVPAHRQVLLKDIFPGRNRLEGSGRDILVFDEIHKYPRWKNTLKGLFDMHEPKTHWMITGSAMLNVYRRGQDSLMGRQFTYHLAPFSVAELSGICEPMMPPDVENLMAEKPETSSREALESLLRFGGFPEPLFKATDSFLTRWRTTRLDRLVNQDLAATEHLRHLPLVENLMLLLPERVGSPLSLNSLRQDLEIHHGTVKHWMDLLERVFYGFYVPPYSRRLARSLRREAKWYLWDWTSLQDPGARFENLVAVHLKKYVDYVNDSGAGTLSLHYVRDKEKREVDFLVCSERNPFLLVECKVSDTTPASSLIYFGLQLGLKTVIQLVQGGDGRIVEREGLRVLVLPAASFLRRLV